MHTGPQLGGGGKHDSNIRINQKSRFVWLRLEKTFLDGWTREPIRLDRWWKLAVSLWNLSVDAEPWRIISTAYEDVWKQSLALSSTDLLIMAFTSHLCQTPISMCVCFSLRTKHDHTQFRAQYVSAQSLSCQHEADSLVSHLGSELQNTTLTPEGNSPFLLTSIFGLIHITIKPPQSFW